MGHDERIHQAEPGEHSHGGAVRVYIIIFAILMVLAALTVVAAMVNFDHYLPGTGHYINLTIAFTIAIIKGTLIILYFMHVLNGPRRAVVFAVAGFLWLAIMLVLTFADYGTRRWPDNTNPKGEPRFLWESGDRRPAR